MSGAAAPLPRGQKGSGRKGNEGLPEGGRGDLSPRGHGPLDALGGRREDCGHETAQPEGMRPAGDDALHEAALRRCKRRRASATARRTSSLRSPA